MKKIEELDKQEMLKKIEDDLYRRIKVELVSDNVLVQHDQNDTDKKASMKSWVKSNPIFNDDNER